MERDQQKLQASLGGIREMGGLPDLLFVVDVGKEDLAVSEARKLGIPVVAVVDTNCSPDGVDYVIPGNDDAARAIALYCDLAARAALDGMSAQLGAAGVDLGAMEEQAAEDFAAEQEAARAAARGEEEAVEEGAEAALPSDAPSEVRDAVADKPLSDEAVHDDAMAKDAPYDLENSQ